jgi:general secretion pathway protein E
MPDNRDGESHVQLSEEQIGIEATDTGAAVAVDDPVSTYLLENNRLRSADLRRAQTYQEQHGGDLVTLLVRLGLVSERDVAEAEAGLLDLPLVRTADLPEQVPEVPDISVRFLKQNLILPIAESNGDLTVVMANPRDGFARKALSMASGKNIVTRVGVASEIENGIEKLLGGGRSAMGQIVESLGGEESSAWST